MMKSHLISRYDSLAPRRDDFRRKNKYYYALLDKQYRYFVPEGKRILEIGCGTGELLALKAVVWRRARYKPQDDRTSPF